MLSGPQSVRRENRQRLGIFESGIAELAVNHFKAGRLTRQRPRSRCRVRDIIEARHPQWALLLILMALAPVQ